MYAIVKSKSGHFYTSMVFGYFCKITATDDYQQYLESVHNQYYLVLSEDKSRLVKKYVFPWKDKYLDPQILIVDASQPEWILDEKNHGCVSFLCGTDFNTDDIILDPAVLEKCISMDATQAYQEYVEINTEADIENLYSVSGYFHDAYIKKCEHIEDTIYVLFDGVWGCKIELWFSGDTAFCIDSRDPEYEDPYWFGSTILHDDGYYYLVDEDDMKVHDITDKYCWFKGRHLKYHVIPNP